MTPKEIRELKTIGYHHWPETDAFWAFVHKEINDEMFDDKDAQGDTRITVQLKAQAEETHNLSTFHISYWAITFDGKLVGIVLLWGKVNENEIKYITNYPLYQAMIGYVKTMYTPANVDEIVGEEEDVKDLERLYGWVIDKRYTNNMRKEDK